MATSGHEPRGIGAATWAAACIGLIMFGAGTVILVPSLQGTIKQFIETKQQEWVPSKPRSEQRAPALPSGPVVAFRYSPPRWPNAAGDFVLPSQVGSLIEVTIPHGTYRCADAFLDTGRADFWSYVTQVNQQGYEVPRGSDSNPALYRIDKGNFTFSVAWSNDPTCRS